MVAARKKRRVLLIADMSWKRLGGRLASTDRKILSGLWRNGDLAYEVSDRDLVKYLGGPFKGLGERRVNAAILEIAKTVRPHVVLISNSRAVTVETIEKLRTAVPGVRIGNYTVDALFVPRNLAHQQERARFVDACFATQSGEMLEQVGREGCPTFWIPNPVDPAFDMHRNGLADAADLPVDLLFCGSGSAEEPRTQRVSGLKDRLADIRFDVRGTLGTAPVEGVDYLDLLGKTKAGLGMNREEHPLYASDRLAQLMGNGIATLIDRASGYQQFFEDGVEAEFYSEDVEIIEKAKRLATDDDHRKRIGEEGYRKCHRRFASHLVASYLVDATLDPSVKASWAN